MSRTAKWILGILIGVIVLAALAAAGIFLWNNWSGGPMMEVRALRGWRDGRDLRLWDMPMHRNNETFYMHGSRFPFWSPLGWILGGLLRLGLWVLVIVGVVFLVRAVWPARPPTAPVQPAQPPAAPVESTAACPNCGFPVEEGWKHCPNCAHDLGA